MTVKPIDPREARARDYAARADAAYAAKLAERDAWLAEHFDDAPTSTKERK